MIHHAASSMVLRVLSDSEHALIRWLLTRGTEITGTDAKLALAFIPQLDDMHVVGRCSCGCPSIDLAVAAEELVVPDVSGILADTEGRSPEGTEIGVILRAKGGILTELELYARDGQVPFSIPGAKQLEAFW